MRMGYFDAAGSVILIADGAGMGPPPGTQYMAELPEQATANNIYYDIDADAWSYREPFDLTVARNLIAGIPLGTVATIEGEHETVDDGDIEFVADVEQTIAVNLEHPRFLYETVEVETGP